MTTQAELIDRAKAHFADLVKEQFDRVDRMKAGADWIDYGKVKPIVIGMIGGDGIGPYISELCEKVLGHLLDEEVKAGKVVFRAVEGLTIENRAKLNAAIPPDVLEDIKKCHVTVKGPTTTPRKGDPWPNIESANVALRKALDLFANVRPVRVPREGINWRFFRENTEGAYAVGSRGLHVSEDLTFDFAVTTTQGAERLIRLAFEYARRSGMKKVTVVTKANVIKFGDGKFLDTARRVAEGYPDVEWDDWYIDIMTAKLVDRKRRTQFKVLALPNLYGDILTDEAAEFQGGVGTAGSANIGKRYAMFEAIHGSAPRMVQEGRAKYADPCSMIRAGAMMLEHLGFPERARRLEMALDITGQYEKKIEITGRSTGCTGAEFVDYLMETMDHPELEAKWRACAEAPA